ncbi:flavodoxin domain-containing protein [Gordonia sp. CPCC 205515]|uniref:flavodoxin domain-containing protein n=1 Tax=Gordonia sp. CPCC 205515 TaxID=3140791 RepID=UPI003AF40855
MGKVLVAYSTKHHSTAEIAEVIAVELRAHGIDAECVDVSDATADGYDAVVLGSAVYAGRWRREAVSFLKHQRTELARKPLWIFSSGPVGDKVDEDFTENSRWLEPRKVLDLAESIGLRGHTVFGGRIPTDPHGFVEKSMAKNTPEELRDARNWDVIRQWADGVAAELTSART